MAEHAHVSEHIDDLASIYDPAIHLAVARRQPDPAMIGFVAEVLNRRCVPCAELIVGPATTIAEHLPEALGGFAAAVTALPGYAEFCRDLELQVAIFTDLFGINAVGLRIATLQGPMCPRFHVDHVPCRLITTYGGRGTEWLPEEYVDRRQLGCADLPLRHPETGDGATCALEPWAIGLFRGEGWLDGSVGGVVHRSPHIAPAQPRLLMTLDFVR
ncbi:MAG: DUF1826 domain-containing protein [Gammaproteobacteria bacterium]|nr:DUF1826 domain-containing protein [Gammaproteobacteria bacterium]